MRERPMNAVEVTRDPFTISTANPSGIRTVKVQRKPGLQR